MAQNGRKGIIGGVLFTILCGSYTLPASAGFIPDMGGAYPCPDVKGARYINGGCEVPTKTFITYSAVTGIGKGTCPYGYGMSRNQRGDYWCWENPNYEKNIANAGSTLNELFQILNGNSSTTAAPPKSTSSTFSENNGKNRRSSSSIQESETIISMRYECGPTYYLSKGPGALRECDRYVQENPTSSLAYFNRARTLLEKGDRKSACRDLISAREKNPTPSTASSIQVFLKDNCENSPANSASSKMNYESCFRLLSERRFKGEISGEHAFRGMMECKQKYGKPN